MKRKYWILIAGAAVMLIVIFSYCSWNNADPANTCARCHEVSVSHEKWVKSAHAKVNCNECHGTALSNGFRSFKEKAGMVLSHISGDVRNEDIHLSETQILEIADRCASCHQSEYGGWLSSGHAVNYREIFMDAAHHASEKPYWDCFRCHGMFYDGNINTLMNLEGEPHEWKIMDTKQESRPTIPCLACHQIHAERHPHTALYMRSDKMYLRSDFLYKVQMMDGEREIKSANDPNTLLCMQCHAPNYMRQAGSEDDRTPVGVHEGISCTACHRPHSGNTRYSCDQCHPAMSNCGIDVKTMNTTYKDSKSKNDIHRINCRTCHSHTGSTSG